MGDTYLGLAGTRSYRGPNQMNWPNYCNKHLIIYIQSNTCQACDAESPPKLGEKPKCTYHEWVEYVGFTDKYEYCKKCGAKK